MSLKEANLESGPFSADCDLNTRKALLLLDYQEELSDQSTDPSSTQQKQRLGTQQKQRLG